MASDRWRALLILLLLPGTLNEFLSGATPLPAALNPVVLAFILGFYGGGTLCIRELVVRWGGGLARALPCGMAFGILLEGVVTRTFFSTANAQVGSLASYGNWGGVNWVWAVLSTLGDAWLTVAVPILLVWVSALSCRETPLLSRRWFFGLAIVVAIFPLVAVATSPPTYLPWILASVGIVLALFSVARFMTWPWNMRMQEDGRGHRWWRFAGVGVLVQSGSILIPLTSVGLGFPAILPIVELGLLYGLAFFHVAYGRHPTTFDLFLLASGSITVLFIPAVVHAFSGYPWPLSVSFPIGAFLLITGKRCLASGRPAFAATLIG